MKKTILYATAALMLAVLPACGQQQPQPVGSYPRDITIPGLNNPFLIEVCYEGIVYIVTGNRMTVKFERTDIGPPSAAKCPLGSEETK